jgi:hypothetical protein
MAPSRPDTTRHGMASGRVQIRWLTVNYADRFRDSNRLLGRRGDVNSFRHSCAFLHPANKGRARSATARFFATDRDRDRSVIDRGRGRQSAQHEERARRHTDLCDLPKGSFTRAEKSRRVKKSGRVNFLAMRCVKIGVRVIIISTVFFDGY